MGKHCKLVIVWFVQAFFRRVRRSVFPLLGALILLFNAHCALTMGDLEYSAPKAEVVHICDKPLDVPSGINLWAYDTMTGRIVTGEDEGELRYFAGVAADMLFQYDPDAPTWSAKKMPERFGLTCRKPKLAFPDSVPILSEASFGSSIRSRCPADVADVGSSDPRFFAAPPEGKKRCEPAPAKAPKRIPVCVRPPGISKDVNEWAKNTDGKGNVLISSPTKFTEATAKVDIIFIYDKHASAESVYWFVTDPAKLSCPEKPPPRPYKHVDAAKMLEAWAALDSLSAAAALGTGKGTGQTASSSGTGGQGTGKTAPTKPDGKGDGKTSDTSSPDGQGPPLDFLEMLSRNLQYPAALMNGITDSAENPNGARHGAIGGQNEGGADILLVQAIHGTFSIIQNPFKSTKEFVEAITTAVSQKRTAVILDPKVLTKEIAEKLAADPSEAEVKQAIKGEIVESYGKAMATSLQEAGVIMPYSRAQVFTAGWEAKYQAHHILEVNMFKTLGKEELAKDGPAVILTKAEHDYITGKLAVARKELWDNVWKRGGKDALPTKAEVWQMYQKVYAKYPNWLEAIKGHFQ